MEKFGKPTLFPFSSSYPSPRRSSRRLKRYDVKRKRKLALYSESYIIEFLWLENFTSYLAPMQLNFTFEKLHAHEFRWDFSILKLARI